MAFFRGMFSLLGRVMLCAVFALSALMSKIPHFTDTVKKMETAGMPLPKLMLVGAIVILLVGSLFVVSGYAARLGALLLLLFLALATYYFHPFWKFEDGTAEHGAQMIQFMKNLALGGALLMIIANGPGAWSWGSKRNTEDEEYLE